MQKALLLTVVAILAHSPSPVTSYRILMLANNLRSHVIYYSRLAQVLVSRGHEVTLVCGEGISTHDAMTSHGIDVRFYKLRAPPLAEEEWFKLETLGLAYESSVLKIMEGLGRLVERVEGEHGQILEDDALFAYLRAREFHFTVTDQMDAYFVTAYALDAPFATLAIECMWYEFRAPYMPSYVPSLFGGLSDRMTFTQRLTNTAFYLLMTPGVFRRGGHDKVARHAPHRNVMGVAEVNAQASLCLRLREPVTDTPRGFTPNIINVGSLLVREAGELPDNLAEFVGGATEGLLVLTFGSWLDVWPGGLAASFLDAFSRLPYRVLWKYRGALPRQPPPNVKVMDWLPQNEVLAHAYTRAFLTHCGNGGFHEAVYHGVPILGFPMAIDQKTNAAIIASRGYGLVLDIATLTADALVADILNVTKDARFRQRIAAASGVLKDRPPGADTASYWIEHVIKHGDAHLRSAAYTMPWYQFMCLDIAAALLGALVTLCLVTAALLWACWRIFCRRCKPARKDKSE